MMRPNVSSGAAQLTWAGETLALLPQRALHWPAASTLFITDPHFGKAATLRSAGIPIPQGSTRHDLDHLDALLAATDARRLVILGDFFHARAGRAEPVLAALGAWRARRPDLSITLVRGNHDRHAGDPPDAWNVQTVTEPFPLPPFICYHQPLEPAALADVHGHVLAGHLHPQVSLRAADGSQLRIPCFWFGKEQAVLPAFGSFTGGYTVRPRPRDRLFVVGPRRVVEAATGARLAHE
jgi:DNA ligase-associated metallophosphoesterase